MPSKIQLDENLWFLYVCLQKSDYKALKLYHSSKYLTKAKLCDTKIDFNAVGNATNLKPPAARMRYTRLRRQIEGGTLIGTHGTPFAGGAEKIAEAMRKRKKNGCGGDNAPKSEENRNSSSVESERRDSDDIDERGGNRGTGPKKGGRKGVTRVKIENSGGQFGCESEGQSDSGEDSDDDKPIVKRRGRPIGYRIQNRELGAVFPAARSAKESGREGQAPVTSNRECFSRQPKRVPEAEAEVIETQYPNFRMSLRESLEAESNSTTNASSNAEKTTSPSISNSTILQPRFIHKTRPYNPSHFRAQPPFANMSPEFPHRVQVRSRERSPRMAKLQYDFIPIPSLPS